MGAPKSYSIRVKKSAEKELNGLPKTVFQRVVSEILALELNPRPKGCKRLKGRDEYRLRIGSYRVLYLIDDSDRKIEIVAIGHRREVYRG